MRFLADMGVDWRVVQWLRQQGHDAVHLRDEGLQRLPDREIFAKVVLFRLHNTRTPHVIDRLAAVLAHAAAELEQGAVVIVEDGRHRVRQMPVGVRRES